jgi:hypothetical protein
MRRVEEKALSLLYVSKQANKNAMHHTAVMIKRANWRLCVLLTSGFLPFGFHRAIKLF